MHFIQWSVQNLVVLMSFLCGLLRLLVKGGCFSNRAGIYRYENYIDTLVCTCYLTKSFHYEFKAMCLVDSRLLPSFLLSPCVHIHPLRDTSLCLNFFTPVNLRFSFLFIRMSWSSLARGADPHAMCLVLSFGGFVDEYSLSLSYSLEKISSAAASLHLLDPCLLPRLGLQKD
jgi:hypothetical protein